VAKFKKYLLPPAIIVFAIVVVVIVASNRPSPPEREPMVSAMLVDVIEAQQSDGNFSVTAQGTVRPRTQTSVSAEVGGQLVMVSDRFVAGGFFEKGEVLAQIDPSNYEAALLQASAELASAQARFADERARSEQAKRDWERIHGTERQANDLVLRLPQLAGAKAAVDAAEAAVYRAQRNLERTQITLPYAGMVRARNVDLGQYVNAGMVLGVTFAVDAAEVRLPLSTQDRAFLNLPRAGEVGMSGPEVVLRANVDGQWDQWTGRVVRTEGVIDENTRLSYAVVVIEDPYQKLGTLTNAGGVLPMGTFVEGVIEGKSSQGLIRLPRAALRGGDTVFVANDENELEIRSVEVVRATTEEIYVRNNIRPGSSPPASLLRFQAPSFGSLAIWPAPQTQMTRKRKRPKTRRPSHEALRAQLVWQHHRVVCTQPRSGQSFDGVLDWRWSFHHSDHHQRSPTQN